MTAARPGDELREALHAGIPELSLADCALVADAVLPVVTAWAERQARERAAEELTALAFSLLDLGLPDLVFEKIVTARDALTADQATP